MPTTLPKGMQWLPHAGMRQRLRILRQRLRPVLALKDEASVAARERAMTRGRCYEHPEYVASNIMLTAMEASDANRIPFAEAVNCIIDQLDAEDRATQAQALEVSP